MDKKKNQNKIDYDNHNFDNFAFVKDMKMPDRKNPKLKKSDIFVTKDSRKLESIVRKKGSKNGIYPFQKKHKRGVVEMS
tara:strand:- start:1752 stop:1988 length:237 start_codon:yes stop_codon:yes gene_type:complete